MQVSPSELLVLRNEHAVPVLSFAARAITDPAEVYDATSTALAAGYRSVLTTPEARNEEGVGLAIRDSRLPRSAVRVSTELQSSAWTTDAVVASVESSLEVLGVDELDAIVMTPGRGARHARTRDDDTRWRALEFFHEEHDILALGLRGFSGRDLTDFVRRQHTAPHFLELHDELDDRTRAAVVRWGVGRTIAVRRALAPTGSTRALQTVTALEWHVAAVDDRSAPTDLTRSRRTGQRSVAIQPR